MRHAPFYLFWATVIGGFGRGQAHTVHRASKEAGKAQTMRGAGTVRYWFNDTRPGRPSQSYAGMAG